MTVLRGGVLDVGELLRIGAVFIVVAGKQVPAWFHFVGCIPPFVGMGLLPLQVEMAVMELISSTEAILKDPQVRIRLVRRIAFSRL